MPFLKIRSLNNKTFLINYLISEHQFACFSLKINMDTPAAPKNYNSSSSTGQGKNSHHLQMVADVLSPSVRSSPFEYRADCVRHPFLQLLFIDHHLISQTQFFSVSICHHFAILETVTSISIITQMIPCSICLSAQMFTVQLNYMYVRRRLVDDSELLPAKSRQNWDHCYWSENWRQKLSEHGNLPTLNGKGTGQKPRCYHCLTPTFWQSH